MDDILESINGTQIPGLSNPDFQDKYQTQLHSLAQQCFATEGDVSSEVFAHAQEGFGIHYVRSSFNVRPGDSDTDVGFQPCSQWIIDEISSKEEPVGHDSLPYPLGEALSLFIRGRLDDDRQRNEKEKARQRLETFLKKGLPETWDLPGKVFNDLDTLYFQGELRGRIYLCWEIIAGQPTLLGETWPSPHLRVRIMIRLRYNQDWSRLPARCMMGVLVHEMLHAWFFLKCGFHYTQPDHHGSLWTKAAQHIMESLEVPILWPHGTHPVTSLSEELQVSNQCRRKQAIVDFLGLRNLQGLDPYHENEGLALDVIAARQNYIEIPTSLGGVYVQDRISGTRGVPQWRSDEHLVAFTSVVEEMRM